jgi:hypothetical protein
MTRSGGTVLDCRWGSKRGAFKCKINLSCCHSVTLYPRHLLASRSVTGSSACTISHSLICMHNLSLAHLRAQSLTRSSACTISHSLICVHNLDKERGHCSRLSSCVNEERLAVRPFVCVCACARARVHACVCVCARVRSCACVRARARACVFLCERGETLSNGLQSGHS